MNGTCRFAGLAAALAVVALLASCALYRNDRCYVPDEEYAQARNLYLQSGTLDLVQRQLVAWRWERCKINETIYRLQKEFQVLPEVVPAPVPPPPPPPPPPGQTPSAQP